MVPECLASKPLTPDLPVLTPGFLHSATIPVLFSPSAHSHQGPTFHWLLWCSWQSDVAEVLWECFLLCETHSHGEKGSSSIRHGFVFKCYQLRALRQAGRAHGWDFKHPWIPVLPKEAELGYCHIDLIPFCIYPCLFCQRETALPLNNIYLPGKKRGRGFCRQKTV